MGEVPFPLKEMWEHPESKGSELVEDVRQKSPIMYFKVKACFASQSHDFLQDEPNWLNEQRVDQRVNHLRMVLSWVLIQDYVVLNKEMRHIIIQVHILRYRIQSNQLRSTLHCERVVLRWCFRDWLPEVLLYIFWVQKFLNQILSSVKICDVCSSDLYIFSEQRVFVVDVQTVFKCGVLFLRHLDELFDERTLRNCEWLSDDNVVALREQGESIFNKLQTPSFEDFIDAEKIDDNSVVTLVRDIRELIVFYLIDNLFILSKIPSTFVSFFFFCQLFLLLLFQYLYFLI